MADRNNPSKLAELARNFSKEWADWRFNGVVYPPEPLLEAANALTDFMTGYEFVEHEGQKVEVWQDGLTRSWYIGTPAGTNVGPLPTREMALEIAACHFSQGPAE